VITPEAAGRIAELGLFVVTQPGFAATRGDAYLADVDALDIPHLYRCASLVQMGIEVGCSTDAPFGELDPWRAMHAAVERRTELGFDLGAGERLTPEAALGPFLSAVDRPGGPARRIAKGLTADLCLLDEPLAVVLSHLSSDHVLATIIAGQLVYHRDRSSSASTR